MSMSHITFTTSKMEHSGKPDTRQYLQDLITDYQSKVEDPFGDHLTYIPLSRKNHTNAHTNSARSKKQISSVRCWAKTSQSVLGFHELDLIDERTNWHMQNASTVLNGSEDKSEKKVASSKNKRQ